MAYLWGALGASSAWLLVIARVFYSRPKPRKRDHLRY
jgi:hypothetical protein